MALPTQTPFYGARPRYGLRKHVVGGRKSKIYQLKLEVLYHSKNPGVTVDPYQIGSEEWKDDVTLWPPVEFGQIYTYLVETPGPFTREMMKAYKSLEAFRYYIRYDFSTALFMCTTIILFPQWLGSNSLVL